MRCLNNAPRPDKVRREITAVLVSGPIEEFMAERRSRRRPEARYANRLTKARAVFATSRQPLSITSACPRSGILAISVTALLRFCCL